MDDTEKTRRHIESALVWAAIHGCLLTSPNDIMHDFDIELERRQHRLLSMDDLLYEFRDEYLTNVNTTQEHRQYSIKQLSTRVGLAF